MRVERKIEIDAPADRVYDLVMDPRRLGDWVTIHVGLKEAPNGGLQKGSEMVQCLKLAGRRFDVHWEVVKADKPRRVVWEGKGPVHSRAKVVYDLDPDGDGKTCFSYMNEYSMPASRRMRARMRCSPSSGGVRPRSRPTMTTFLPPV